MAITPRGADQYMIRFPDGLRDRLKEAAKDNARSMNSEVITRLEASFTVAREVNSEVAALLSGTLRPRFPPASKPSRLRSPPDFTTLTGKDEEQGNERNYHH